jgi:hypothetical protein
MKTSKIIVNLLLIAGLGLFYTSCKKDRNPTPDQKDTATAADNAKAEYIYEDASTWSDRIMSGVSYKSTLVDTVYMGTCVLATLDLSVMPYKLTIDFGAQNCLCDDGRWRRGKIIVTFNGGYFQAGTIITTTFENYFVNNNQVLGTKTVTNMGRNNNGNLWWDIAVSGQIIKANSGGVVFWNSDRAREWIEGEGQPWYKWVYLITGTANGTNANGKSYTVNITAPLKVKFNCEWIVSGTLEIQVENAPLVILDYGNGTCDNIATVTINGQTYTITLD